MSATKPVVRVHKDEGLATVRVVTETLRLVTDKRLELYNLTEKVADIVKRHDIKDGHGAALVAAHDGGPVRERVAVRAPARRQGACSTRW